MKFKGDIIITDPCYIFRDKDWDKYCDHFDCSFISELGFTDYIWEDTVTGDWSQEVVDTRTGRIIGNFCADAGLVGVFYLHEVLKYSPSFDVDRSHSRAIIKNFDGEISHSIKRNRRYIVGKGNIDFYTDWPKDYDEDEDYNDNLS